MRVIFRYTGTIDQEYTIPDGEVEEFEQLFGANDQHAICDRIFGGTYVMEETSEINSLRDIIFTDEIREKLIHSDN